MAITQRRMVMVSLCTVALLAVAGCVGGGTVSSASSPAATSATVASSAASQTYSSKAFVVPLTVTVDPALKSPPNPDSHNLLSWDAVASQGNKVRFLVPVVVFRGGKETPQAPPKEYLKFLMAQAKDGAVFSNVTKTTADGHPATQMDAIGTAPEGFSPACSAAPSGFPTSTVAASGSSRICPFGWPSSMSVIPR
jgi:hypothetical protein